MDQLPIIGTMGTMPTRIHSFRKMLPQVRNQVDRLFIYLDGFQEIPEFLFDQPKCEVIIPSPQENLHASNRFLAPHQFGKPCMVVLFDDDIAYPPDYVDCMRQALAKHGERAVVGFHGGTFQPPHQSYTRDRSCIHFVNGSNQDQIVHYLGSGTYAFLSTEFMPDPRTWRYRNMDDLYLAAESVRSNKMLLCLKRKAHWLRAIEENQADSIWQLAQKDDRIHSEFMRDLLAQYAMMSWRHWWTSNKHTNQQANQQVNPRVNSRVY